MLQANAGCVDVPVSLAQGHYSLANTWWIGGNAVLHYGSPLLLVIANKQIKWGAQAVGRHQFLRADRAVMQTAPIGAVCE
ncbi:hypothetical protein SAMN02745857_01465 [Andreprevotia lacus DSM 23236]|jgi:hypothetical protein|uniref:Uncharacterized protein n=1 Tax=Andreprevotia lacus DSM 23236 TaxID=1121001 RepID=A0A1W1XFS3_9NEIS|nr:hypothetical protein SAMN02745857_01465 [Andreprevotia lacus DSM 23236]